MEPKGNSIELSMFLKYGLTKVKKSSVKDVQLGSKYASVSITLHLTFLKKNIVDRKLWHFVKFYLKRNKIIRVHVKDKSCNSPEGLQLY